jgi:hypothetical protein
MARTGMVEPKSSQMVPCHIRVSDTALLSWGQQMVVLAEAVSKLRSLAAASTYLHKRSSHQKVCNSNLDIQNAKARDEANDPVNSEQPRRGKVLQSMFLPVVNLVYAVPATMREQTPTHRAASM